MDALEKLKEFKWVILSSVILVLSVLFFVFAGQDNKASPQNEIDPLEQLLSNNEDESVDGTEEEASIKDNAFVLVDVKGAVNSPGVYQLEGKSRVIDAITIAGGLTDEAITTHVNFAKQLVDEMLIYIPVEGDEVVTVPQETDSGIDSHTVNINTASASELETLSGIGPQKAQEIIRYREEKGHFKTIEELTHVSGIGDKTFEKLKDYIMVD